MIINFDKHDLFSLPIFKVKIDPNSYDKKSFLETVKTNYEIDPTRCNHFPENDEFGNLHHSYADTENKNFKQVDYQGFGISYIYDSVFKSFTSELKTIPGTYFGYDWTLENYTAINDRFQYMKPHQHLPESDFASVHYISFDKDVHKSTSFINQNTFSSYLRYIRPEYYGLMDKNSIENSYHYHQWFSNVEEDDMVIFPSCLQHEIPKQEKNSDKLRVTVSCNLSIRNINEETQ